MPFDNTRIDELILLSYTEEEREGLTETPTIYLPHVGERFHDDGWSLVELTEEDIVAEKQELLDLLHAKLVGNYPLTPQEMSRMLKLERET